MDNDKTTANPIAASAHSLEATITELTQVLEAESTNIYTGRNEQMSSFYREKTRLLADYAAGVSALRTATDNGQHDLPAELNTTLKLRSQSLAAAMQRNMASLAVAQEASQKVVEAIIDAVKQQRRTGAAYGSGKDGLAQPPADTGDLAKAVTLDEKL